MPKRALSWLEIQKQYPLAARAILTVYRRISVNGCIKREPGYVYIMWAKDSPYYKIGKTSNPHRRLGQIAPKMPFTTEIACVIKTDNMTVLERHMHECYEPYRVNGEWFLLDQSDVAHYTAIKHVGIETVIYELITFECGSIAAMRELNEFVLSEIDLLFAEIYLAEAQEAMKSFGAEVRL